MAEVETRSIDRSPNRVWYYFCRAITHRLFFDPLGGIESHGAENVPRSGGVIIAPIHLSNVDPPAIASATSRHLRFMAKSDLFKGWFGRLITSVGAFPVSRGESDTESVRRAIAILQKGEALLIFPEGSRGDGKRLCELSRGLGMIAKKGNAMIVPTSIVGSHVVLPKGSSKPKRHRITVRFGVPFRYADIEDPKKNFTEVLAAKMIELAKLDGLNLDRRSDGEIGLHVPTDQTKVEVP